MRVAVWVNPIAKREMERIVLESMIVILQSIIFGLFFLNLRLET